MAESNESQINKVLQKMAGGHPIAVNQLLPLVYDELRSLANRYLSDERRNHTLQPTALVNEICIKLLDHAFDIEWQNRAHFRGVVARAMRQLLVDHARHKGAAKRGGGWQRLTLGELDESTPMVEVDLLALNETLERLTQLDEQMGRVVEMRFFAGMNNEEVAHVLGVTSRTVRNKLSIARAWLSRELGNGDAA